MGSPQFAPNSADSRYLRMYGTWTLLSGIIRLYTVWRFGNFSLYILTMCTYGLAVVYFSLERVVFQVKDPKAKWAIGVAAGTLAWMATELSLLNQPRIL